MKAIGPLPVGCYVTAPDGAEGIRAERTPKAPAARGEPRPATPPGKRRSRPSNTSSAVLPSRPRMRIPGRNTSRFSARNRRNPPYPPAPLPPVYGGLGGKGGRSEPGSLQAKTHYALSLPTVYTVGNSAHLSARQPAPQRMPGGQRQNPAGLALQHQALNRIEPKQLVAALGDQDPQREADAKQQTKGGPAGPVK